ncbi:MAG: hypothetical protein RIR10_2061 [Planctomycetota bacterium]
MSRSHSIDERHAAGPATVIFGGSAEYPPTASFHHRQCRDVTDPSGMSPLRDTDVFTVAHVLFDLRLPRYAPASGIRDGRRPSGLKGGERLDHRRCQAAA